MWFYIKYTLSHPPLVEKWRSDLYSTVSSGCGMRRRQNIWNTEK
jgi:hypothetical protein